MGFELKSKYRTLNKKKVIAIYLISSFVSYLLYWFLKYKFGLLDKGEIFFDPADRFADLLKIIFSFDFIFSKDDLIKLKVPKLWINGNPYSGIYFGNATATMALPPLTIIFLTTSAYMTNFISINYMAFFIVLIIFLFFCSLLQVSKYKNAFANFLFIITSYPFLFLIDRGNLMAGISALFLFSLFNKFVKNKIFTNLDVLYFILACSIRPNYLIFGLLFLIKKNMKENVLNLIKIGFSYIASNAIFFVIAGNLLPNYNFQNFRMMVNFYFTNPLSFSHWNSSLYGAIFNSYRFIFQYLESYNFKIVSNFIDRVVYSAKLPDLISIFFLSILLIFYRWYLKNQESKISFLIILSCTTILITHPIGDYHLVILVYLFLTIYNSNKADLYSTSLLIIAIIILPKVHMNSPNLNFSNLVNTLFLLWLYYINYFKYRINSQKRFNTE